jgi:hypothetical protein
MSAGLSVAIALLAEAPVAVPADLAPTAVASARPDYGPARPKPPPTPPASPVKTADEACAAATAKTDSRQIVICAQRPQGYRLNPDLMEARREMRSGGRPTSPHETFKDNSCTTVGPAGCIGAAAGINLLGAATTLATMATRVAKGEEIGSMFQTTPQPTEYQLYLSAKQRREAREAEEALAAKVKAMQAASKHSNPAEAPKETSTAR